MKIVKTLLFAIVATCFFGSAKAQIRVRIGQPVHHRVVVVHRPVHRRVVVVHRPVHHYHRRHVVVVRHRR